MVLIDEELSRLINDYSFSDKEKIYRALSTAIHVHKEQKRNSGEAYIVHPLSVATILAENHADADTICAGLLHDTVEDGKNYELSNVYSLFGENIMNLVDGVTKIKNDGENKDEIAIANFNKIITSIFIDIRIIMIKLADRLHNMRTLQFKKVEKQKKVAKETLEIYAQIAGYLGAYDIKDELETLCYLYLEPELYSEIAEYLEKIQVEYATLLRQKKVLFELVASEKKIPLEFSYNLKPIGEIITLMFKGFRIEDINDLVSISLTTDTVKNCYRLLEILKCENELYKGDYKDYIKNPKSNMYKSIHYSSLFDDKLHIQYRIQTHEMSDINHHGLMIYWSKGLQSYDIMQNKVKNYPFYKKIRELKELFKNSAEFESAVRKDVLCSKINVLLNDKMCEIKEGSTINDLILFIEMEYGEEVISAKVGNQELPGNYRIKYMDDIKLVTKPKKEKIRSVITEK